MITEFELYDLGYEIKTKLINGSIDFRFTGSVSSPYLVNLHEGVVQIIWEYNSNKSNTIFDNIEDFKQCHHK